MTLPNFLVIGTARGASTSLYRYLSAHPEVFMSRLKEPRFFAFEGQPPDFKGPGDEYINQDSVWDAAAYEALFDGAQAKKAIGEVSPIYLYSEDAPRKIRNRLPDVRLIAMLRDPCDRAFSHFWINRRRGAEPEEDFATALALEDKRVAAGWGPRYHYARWGFYHRQLSRYLDLFPRDQIRIYKYEDFAAYPLETFRDMCNFLKIDSRFEFGRPRKYNAPLSRRSRLLNYLLRRGYAGLLPGKIRRYATKKAQEWDGARPSIPRKVRENLAETFAEDSRALAKLLEWDISDWSVSRLDAEV